MSKRKAYEPDTSVPGGYGAKPIGHMIHFKTAAAKRRAQAAAAERGIAYSHVGELIPLAQPRDLVKVPVFRGFSARLANEIRFRLKYGRPLNPVRGKREGGPGIAKKKVA